MTKTTFKEHLRKVQQLQMLAYEHGLSTTVNTLAPYDDEVESCCGYIFVEGVDFVADREKHEKSIYFFIANFYEEEEIRQRLAIIENLIYAHANNK